MRNTLLVFVSILSLFFLKLSWAQDLDKILRILKDNKLEEIKANLPRLLRRYPNNPTPLYIQAFIEPDGDKAVEFYKKLLRKFPECPYADDAKFRIAQYYFAKGLYITARKHFRELLSSYPDSPYADEAQYLATSCLLATGMNKAARDEFEAFLRTYAQSPLSKLVAEDLKETESSWEESFFTKEKHGGNNSSPQYTIQIGAYTRKSNALVQQKYFLSKGYPVEIGRKEMNGKKFYLVWIGKFESREAALNFGQTFKRKYGLSFHVVKKTL